ncbi:hypothetical protein PR048_005226 [Dryococelus australis]|uniref:Uncharacterized protein n=1 Tax=Dryococelus australis TaxID=614101 RepID=A0ABQ9I8Q7_9NEOP|nr:hypothetical protein PR048_005226 [Dryococelus australis]
MFGDGLRYFFAMLNMVSINTPVINSGNGFDITNHRTFLRQLAKGFVTEEMARHNAEKPNLPVTLRHRSIEVITQSLRCTASGKKSQENINQNNKRKLCEP